MKTAIIYLLFIILSSAVSAQRNTRLSSPDGATEFIFQLKNKEAAYSIYYKKKPIIIGATLSLAFLENGSFNKNLSISKPLFREGLEKYQLPLGRTKEVRDSFKEVVISLKENTAPFRKVNLAVRAFNDGIAFRYEFPQQENWQSFSLTEENSTFRFAQDPKVLALFLPNFTTSH